MLFTAAVALAVVGVVAGSDAAGEAYLAQNAQKAGVTTLPSGLQYSVSSATGIRLHAIVPS
jgi:FKBP-type peptidyl-prolyl cis-trans isomerase